MTGTNQRLDPTLTTNFRNSTTEGYPTSPLGTHMARARGPVEPDHVETTAALAVLMRALGVSLGAPVTKLGPLPVFAHANLIPAAAEDADPSRASQSGAARLLDIRTTEGPSHDRFLLRNRAARSCRPGSRSAELTDQVLVCGGQFCPPGPPVSSLTTIQMRT